MVDSDQVTLWDIRETRRPATWPPDELPPSVKNARAAALHPDGQYLALSVPEDNQVLLLDVKPAYTEVKPKQVAALPVLPGMRQPLLRELRFTSDGSTLWLSSGDNPESLPAGHQPTRITAIELKLPPAGTPEPDFGLSVLKTIDLRDAGGPLQLALARTPPVSAGTTIRTPPEKATVFLSTGAVSKTASARSALWRSDLLGHISELEMGATDGTIAGLDVSPDAKLAVTQRIGRAGKGNTLAVTDLETHSDVTLPLEMSSDGDAGTSFDRLRIVLQP
jgi:WD40 repeat protein